MAGAADAAAPAKLGRASVYLFCVQRSANISNVVVQMQTLVFFNPLSSMKCEHSSKQRVFLVGRHDVQLKAITICASIEVLCQ